MLFGIVFTAVNSMLLQQWKINRLNGQVKLSEMQSSINVEWANELLWDRINDVHTLTKDQLVAQGRVEGIVSYLSGDNTQEMNDLWHEGYARGLAQSDYEYEVISGANYEKGYHAAMQNSFPEHPVTSFGFGNETPRNINETPRNVNENAIKTPEFDENNKDLESTEELVDKLNDKIERPDNQ
jgi:hypothetical protein